jgi:plastocyanin
MMTTPTSSPASPRRLFRRIGIALAGVLLVLVALVVVADLVAREALDDDPGPPVSGVTEVAVRDNDFAPDAIEVPSGTTVTWRWEGDNDHNVVGDDFASPVQDEGTFTYTFADPGTHDYRCTLHPFMNGEVVVTE